MCVCRTKKQTNLILVYICVLPSERPEYNKKISSIHTLAGAVYYTNTNALLNPLIKTIDTLKVLNPHSSFCYLIFMVYIYFNGMISIIFPLKNRLSLKRCNYLK